VLVCLILSHINNGGIVKVKKRILFFEDEKGHQYIMKTALEGAGYLVHPISDRNQFNISKINDYDLFLLDIMGKKKDDDGVIIAELIRTVNETIPIIFSTAATEAIPGGTPLHTRIRNIKNSTVLIRPHNNARLLYEINMALGVAQ
jgi:CheY-like chemotaxis protein